MATMRYLRTQIFFSLSFSRSLSPASIDKLSEYMKIDVLTPATPRRTSAAGTPWRSSLSSSAAPTRTVGWTDSSTLVDGIYATQFSITQFQKPNPEVRPTGPKLAILVLEDSEAGWNGDQ